MKQAPCFIVVCFEELLVHVAAYVLPFARRCRHISHRSPTDHEKISKTNQFHLFLAIAVAHLLPSVCSMSSHSTS
jgi:hypothetical protein